jgi:hypothetical protein
MAQVLTERFEKFHKFGPFRPSHQHAGRLDRVLLMRVRGASRERRPRQSRRRTTVRSGSRGDPPQSDDDDPEPDLARVSGVAA